MYNLHTWETNKQGQFCLQLKTLTIWKNKFVLSKSVLVSTTGTNSYAGSSQELVMKIISASAGISPYSACPSIGLICRCPNRGPAGKRWQAQTRQLQDTLIKGPCAGYRETIKGQCSTSGDKKGVLLSHPDLKHPGTERELRAPDRS